MAAPSWNTFLSAAKKFGLSHEEACDAFIAAVAFNGQGFKKSFNIVIDLIPIPSMNHGKKLVSDPKLLESFAWETLRFNGPVCQMPVKKDTIIETSRSPKHVVKKGTILSTLFELVQMDETIWPEPKTFKAGRYLQQERRV